MKNRCRYITLNELREKNVQHHDKSFINPVSCLSGLRKNLRSAVKLEVLCSTPTRSTIGDTDRRFRPVLKVLFGEGRLTGRKARPILKVLFGEGGLTGRKARNSSYQKTEKNKKITKHKLMGIDPCVVDRMILLIIYVI